MNIPFDVINLIASYLVEPKMKLLDWIQFNKNIVCKCIISNYIGSSEFDKQISGSCFGFRFGFCCWCDVM